MNLLTMGAAAKIKYAPSKQYLWQLSKKSDRPDYFFHNGIKWNIDIDNHEWINLLAARQARAENNSNAEAAPKKQRPKKEKKPQMQKQSKYSPTKISDDGEDIEDVVRLQREKLKEEVREKKTKNEILFLNLQRDSKNTVDIAFGEYLWFTHIDRLHLDLMRLGKKIEPIIDNLVKEGKTREIMKRWQNEIETAIQEAKKSQKDDIKEWQEDMGIKK